MKKIFMNKLYSTKLLMIIAFFSCVLFQNVAFANPNTLCNGREFNKRVIGFLSGSDPKVTTNATIRKFEEGQNPPSDPTDYVDVSEDGDGSIIVYSAFDSTGDCSKNGETLYWYSSGNAIMNDDAAYMFSGFENIKNIDLTGFVYLNDLHDTRYMFANCRSLRNLYFKKTNDRPLNLTEVQGMFFNCQSLTNADLTIFDTKHVDNMDEMFYNCYNLRNIYVNKENWNVESVRSFTRMFSGCHLLRSNDGRKAVDVDEDSYEKFAIPGYDNKEGFLKDIKENYVDYGQYEEAVPIDGRNYLMAETETIAAYNEEPEEDGASSAGNAPYVGDKSTGYNADKEVGVTSDMNSTLSSTDILETSVMESSEVIASEPATEISGGGTNATILETSQEIESREGSSDANEALPNRESQSTNAGTSGEDGVSESSGRRVVEIEGDADKGGEDASVKENRVENLKFLLLALGMSLVVILLLVGMVIYLVKDRNGKDSNKI